jgi:hypothetical protein
MECPTCKAEGKTCDACLKKAADLAAAPIEAVVIRRIEDGVEQRHLALKIGENHRLLTKSNAQDLFAQLKKGLRSIGL